MENLRLLEAPLRDAGILRKVAWGEDWGYIIEDQVDGLVPVAFAGKRWSFLGSSFLTAMKRIIWIVCGQKEDAVNGKWTETQIFMSLLDRLAREYHPAEKWLISYLEGNSVQYPHQGYWLISPPPEGDRYLGATLLQAVKNLANCLPGQDSVEKPTPIERQMAALQGLADELKGGWPIPLGVINIEYETEAGGFWIAGEGIGPGGVDYLGENFPDAARSLSELFYS